MSALKIVFEGSNYEYRGDHRPPRTGEHYLGGGNGTNLVAVALADHDFPASIVKYIPETFEYDGITYEFVDFRVAEKGETILKGKHVSGVTSRTRIEYNILKKVG